MRDVNESRGGGRRLLVAHPSPDVYGSDRQLLETVTAAVGSGWQVLVALPRTGPLVAELEARGARCAVVGSTVLRKSLLTPRGMVRLAARTPGELGRLAALVRSCRADAVLVNTVTLPWWAPAARLAGVPCVVHVHEAEATQPRLLRRVMNAPLLTADVVVTNSRAARDVLLDAVLALADRTRVVLNGVEGPGQVTAPRGRTAADPLRVALVARLSPRKGVDVALEALALVRNAGTHAQLTVCGSVFPGYEWYEEQLRERASRTDLAGSVELAGYVHPTWPVLQDSDVVLVPSRVEPFGNTAAEALLARRPVVASRVQGLAEVVQDGRTGLLVPPDDPRALADAVLRLATDPSLAARLATTGRADAAERFSVERYRRDMAQVLTGLVA